MTPGSILENIFYKYFALLKIRCYDFSFLRLCCQLLTVLRTNCSLRRNLACHYHGVVKFCCILSPYRERKKKEKRAQCYLQALLKAH